MGAKAHSTELSRDDLVNLLPDVATTKSGLKFNPRFARWKLEDGVFDLVFNFELIPQGWSDLTTALKLVLVKFLRDGAPTSARSLYQEFLKFSRIVAPPKSGQVEIGLVQVEEYIVGLGESDALRLGLFNVLIQPWFEAGYPGVTEECSAFLRARRKPGGAKGEPVRTHDPVVGPFTNLEYLLLYRAIDNAYEAGSLPLWAFVLSRLAFATGQRTSQYASMKLCDLLPPNSEGWTIQIPLVKQGASHARAEFESHSLSPQTTQLLAEYIRGRRADGATDHSALFPLDGKRVGAGLFIGHCSAKALGAEFQKVIGQCAPPTERLDGDLIPIAIQRFRYTYGTRLAEEGAAPTVIANRLGHTDLQHVSVYVEYTRLIADHIDAAMDEYLIPIARSFKGNIIKDESHASFKGLAGSRIWELKSVKASIGNCGKNGGCAFQKPIACYTCFRFEPWLDAPHGALLERLLREREGHQSRGEHRLAEINDDSILAIKEVMALCAEAKTPKLPGVRT